MYAYACVRAGWEGGGGVCRDESSSGRMVAITGHCMPQQNNVTV